MSKIANRYDIVKIILPFVFLSVWILDSFLFRLTTILNAVIPILIRVILFLHILVPSLILLKLSRDLVVKERRNSKHLNRTSVLAYVRHPLYLSVLLIYISLLILSISIVSICIWIIVAYTYNKLANFEEKELEKQYGLEYIKYKQKVPKFIPRLRRD